MRRSLDMWRCAIIKRPADRLGQADLHPDNLVWLPTAGRFGFRADPFGVWHEGFLHIFVERFDYRTLKGFIELLVYDDRFNLLRTRPVLTKPWHLSYPFVFRADGSFWMLPEARRSGELTLYRARHFPDGWEPVSAIPNLGPIVDPTPVYQAGKWWLFYARMTHGELGSGELNLAFADHLAGPWEQHSLNPVRTGLAATRPAGTPLLRDGWIDLPVQDCSRTYGGSVRRLTITKLDENSFEAHDEPWLDPDPAISRYGQGLHTLSAAGDVSLIDCKRIDRSLPLSLVRLVGKSMRHLRRRSR